MANAQVKARAYLSPTLVLLALDWPDGKSHPDFLGFAIRRAPGFSKGEKQGYLFNKIDFTPLGPGSHPTPSNVAPIQKFLGGTRRSPPRTAARHSRTPWCRFSEPVPTISSSRKEPPSRCR
jgi:hypothetical protein